MDNEIKISVVIPSYNRAKTLKRCLESVINQTYLPYEILVVDDGSTDNTLEVIKDINSPLINVFVQDHGGAQKARNLGIKNAKGDYVAFLDSDDEWIVNKLELQVLELRKNPNVALYTNCYVKNEQTGEKRLWNVGGNSGFVYEDMLKSSGPMFQGMLIKKQILIDMGGLDNGVSAYQEWSTIIRVAKLCEVKHMKEPLFIYYLHSEDTISKNKKKEIDGYYEIIKKNAREIYRTCGKQSLNNHYKTLLYKSILYNDFRYLIFYLKYIFTL